MTNISTFLLPSSTWQYIQYFTLLFTLKRFAFGPLHYFTDRERDFVFLLGLIRNVIYGIAISFFRRLRRGKPLHPDWPTSLEVRFGMCRQVVMWGQHVLYEDETMYPAVNRVGHGLAAIPYVLASTLHSHLVRHRFIVKHNQHDIVCDAWCNANTNSEQIFRDMLLNTTTHQPAATKQDINLLVYMHGGGCCSGGLWPSSSFAIDLVRTHSSFVVIVVDYSLAPYARFPVPIHETLAVLTDLDARLQYSLQSSGAKHTFLIGDSGGGALITSTLMHHAVTSTTTLPCAGVILISPMLSQHHEQSYNSDLAVFDIISAKLAHGTAKTWVPCSIEASTNIVASPILCQDHKLLSCLPRMLIIAGGLEIFVEACRTFTSNIQNAGGRVELVEFPSMIHCFTHMAPDLIETEDAFRHIVKFVQGSITNI